ncbi:MAG: hypothetical protein MnENMB40S_25060 [Rhizobiaceae bacterium MnEN-MB40S]|nr:MAG: hypothetical protein MnENMB40S_25060 [Rhizobiaceae bacterium MnEN-MB40S]
MAESDYLVLLSSGLVWFFLGLLAKKWWHIAIAVLAVSVVYIYIFHMLKSNLIQANGYPTLLLFLLFGGFYSAYMMFGVLKALKRIIVGKRQ